MRKRTFNLDVNLKTQSIDKLERMVTKIMASLEELNAKITELSEKVDLDVVQGASVIAAVNALIAKIPAGVDYQAQVDAVNAIIAKVTTDNPAIQAAIDAANSTNP